MTETIWTTGLRTQEANTLRRNGFKSMDDVKQSIDNGTLKDTKDLGKKGAENITEWVNKSRKYNRLHRVGKFIYRYLAYPHK